MQPQGVRIGWDVLPVALRKAVEDRLGARIVSAQNQPGGFSPGLAARCALADGRRCFIKAVSADQNPDTPRIHRREAMVAARLPPEVPAPRLWASVDDGSWVVLIFEEVDGHQPVLPWTMDALAATFTVLDDLATAATPCPVPDLGSFAERFAEPFTGYRHLAGGEADADRVDPWTRAHLERLAELEAEWALAAGGETLVHADVRADNLLVRPDGSTVLVDWPHACIGAAWLDKACMLPSVALDGGPDLVTVEETLHPFAGADPDAVNRLLVALAGYFTVRGLDPDPPGIPTVRAFQRAQAEVSRAWLAHRLRLA